MTVYIFDTDALSNILKKDPSPSLLERLAAVPSDFQYTTAITVCEIYYGAYRSENRLKIIEAYETKVFPNLKILPFDSESGRICGRLKALMEKKGLPRSEPDLRIAAIAIQHRMILITGNIRHFIDIPDVNVENWINPT